MRTLAFILLSAIGLQGQQFIELAEQVKIGHVTYSPNYMAGGVSIFDFNLDGLQDIYLTGGAYQDHLYVNRGGGQFEDVSESTGITAISDRYTMGVVAGDLDNDGFTDLFISTFKGEQNICLKNVNGEYFIDVTKDAGFFGEDWSASIALADTDKDGDLDVYVTNFLEFTDEPFFRYISEPTENLFFENLGDFKFANASDKIVGARAGCSLACTFSDIDRDGDQDLLVINDFGYQYTPNEVFVNENGKFTEKGSELGFDAAMDGMGVAIGDVDENGSFDYYLSNVGDNLFYLNMQDETSSFNVNDGNFYYSWGTFFADFDHDTYLDLFVAKGSISESDVPRENKFYTYYPYIQNFAEVSSLVNLNSASKARGAAYGDLDNDGDLDLVVNNVRVREQNEGKAEVFMNQDTKGSFVQIELEGVNSNRDGIGAIVELVGEDRRIIRELQGGSSYLSNNSKLIHFGTGNMILDTLNILWPSGLRQSFPKPQNNTRYSLVEGQDLQIVFASTTSVENTTWSPEVKLIPNPASDYLTFDVPSAERAYEICIIDLNGKKVVSKFLVEGGKDVTLDVSKLRSGSYFLLLQNENWESVQKFIVAH